jgi:lipoprotein-anchoring transpeptidase ErfK/SrfK
MTRRSNSLLFRIRVEYITGAASGGNEAMKHQRTSSCLIVVAGMFAFHFAAVARQPQLRQPVATRTRQTQPGDADVKEARERLVKLGYWLDAEADGPDASLRHALIAFQKIECRERTGLLNGEELAALRAAAPPRPREADYTHIEVDLQRQVLLVVDAAKPSVRVLPISTGSGEWFTEGGRTRRALTPVGRFVVQRKIEGWRKSPLGLLYYPNYINEGVAIHGNPSVPPRPASHGCIRIPMFAAKEFSAFTRIGLPVIVYD